MSIEELENSNKNLNKEKNDTKAKWPFLIGFIELDWFNAKKLQKISNLFRKFFNWTILVWISLENWRSKNAERCSVFFLLLLSFSRVHFLVAISAGFFFPWLLSWDHRCRLQKRGSNGSSYLHDKVLKIVKFQTIKDKFVFNSNQFYTKAFSLAP